MKKVLALVLAVIMVCTMALAVVPNVDIAEGKCYYINEGCDRTAVVFPKV